MADVTPHDLLNQIIQVCSDSSIVSAYTIHIVDLDVLSLRIHLVDDSFIEAFYNVTTEKVAFALIEEGRRIYGKDNAKTGWHVHPLDDPTAHHPCDSVDFEDFLRDVESLRFST